MQLLTKKTNSYLIFQYHLPPVRRIPPLLWTRVRSDLPGYLSDSEADGVSVINWYHRCVEKGTPPWEKLFYYLLVTFPLYSKSFDRQFKDAARDRYFKTDADTNYFHSMMSDFFLGKWGGGTPKPFKFTEIQKHRFQLKSKDSEADRQVE